MNRINTIRRRTVATGAGMTLALAMAAQAETGCGKPNMPTMPDGASATMEQMLEGQKAMKAFQAENLEYMTCLEDAFEGAQKDAKDAATTAAREDAEADYSEAVDLYNAAVSAEEELAAAFNAALRAFRDK